MIYAYMKIIVKKPNDFLAKKKKKGWPIYKTRKAAIKKIQALRRITQTQVNSTNESMRIARKFFQAESSADLFEYCKTRFRIQETI